MESGKPWAFLMPAEWRDITIQATKWGCQWIIPTRRIDYITPNTLTRIHEGEVWKLIKPIAQKISLTQYKEKFRDHWERRLADYPSVHNYSALEDVPNNLLVKYTAAQFHSGWLTYQLNLPQQINIVELTIQQKRNIL